MTTTTTVIINVPAKGSRLERNIVFEVSVVPRRELAEKLPCDYPEPYGYTSCGFAGVVRYENVAYMWENHNNPLAGRSNWVWKVMLVKGGTDMGFRHISDDIVLQAVKAVGDGLPIN